MKTALKLFQLKVLSQSFQVFSLENNKTLQNAEFLYGILFIGETLRLTGV